MAALLAFALLTCACGLSDTSVSLAEPNDSSESRPRSAVEIVDGRQAKWIKRALPFLATEGAELVFLEDGAAVLVVGQGAAVSVDLGRTWDVLPPSGSGVRYSNDGGKTFVDLETTKAPWYVNGSYDEFFRSASTCVSNGRLYVFGLGAGSNRISSIGLPPRIGATCHRIFWYHGPKWGCLGAAGNRVFAGGDVREQPVLYVTEDEGATWTPKWWGRTGEPAPKALAFLDSDRGVMLLTDGTIVRTTDGCRTWQTAGSLPVDRAPKVRSMTFVDETVGYAVGEDATALVTRDGARTWLVLKPPTLQHLSRVVAASRESVWIVGDSGTILRSADGGQTWTKVDLGIGENLRSVTLYKFATWIVGDGCLYILPPEDGSPLVPEPEPDPVAAHPFGRQTAPDARSTKPPDTVEAATAPASDERDPFGDESRTNGRAKGEPK